MGRLTILKAWGWEAIKTTCAEGVGWQLIMSPPSPRGYMCHARASSDAVTAMPHRLVAKFSFVSPPKARFSDLKFVPLSMALKLALAQMV